MPSKHDPADSLADIIENAERIRDYVTGMDFRAFSNSRVTVDAVERCLSRSCEAVYRLRDDMAALLPNQPYGEIQGLGNRLRHGYDSINLEIVWNTIQLRLPSLVGDAQAALDKLTNSAAAKHTLHD